jgi:hypothetical protein
VRQRVSSKTDPIPPAQVRVFRAVLTKRTHFPLDARAKRPRFDETNPIFPAFRPHDRQRPLDCPLRNEPYNGTLRLNCEIGQSHENSIEPRIWRIWRRPHYRQGALSRTNDRGN